MRISDWSSDVCSSDREAATQELRKRIRERLLLAERLVDAAPATAASPEAVLTRAVLDAHLASGIETSDALRRRLHAAANDIDLAAIFKIGSASCRERVCQYG